MSYSFKEEKDSFSLQIPVPGKTADDIEVELKESFLKVSLKETKESATFSLPKTGDLDKIGVYVENGMLTSIIPKKEDSKPKLLEIKREAPKLLN